ncbi:hypothetical protein CIHG_08249 [Coccidioides immitis H538.4]|uniref:DUF7492 domain-containing protein n=1 Tax=Coccidioides immitis H538.4 TaxID=396776 RepID=A0A0J8S239_COCIT|nr:hypothetical protein CIHG_08249 [Coccidioides immitis H538.4]
MVMLLYLKASLESQIIAETFTYTEPPILGLMTPFYQFIKFGIPTAPEAIGEGYYCHGKISTTADVTRSMISRFQKNQDIALPKKVPTDKPYTLYWVWDWPTAPNVDSGLPKGKAEIYTTCMDVDIVKDRIFQNLNGGDGKKEYVKDQPLENAAIPSQIAELNNGLVIPDKSGGAGKSTFKTVARPSTKEPLAYPRPRQAR